MIRPDSFRPDFLGKSVVCPDFFLADLAIAQQYENVGEFVSCVAGKVESKVNYRKNNGIAP